MPELPEVESYRRLAEFAALGRPIESVQAPDSWYLKRGVDAAGLDVLVRDRFVAARRRGKLLMLDTANGPTVGLRFGMSGRLVVDGVAGVDALLYSSNAELARFERFAVVFVDGGRLGMRDPRRLGGVELDPDEERLGPDALTIGAAGLRGALARSEVPLKARLLDQSKVAGIGNLIVDETLWRAGLDPGRPAASLDDPEIKRLARSLRRTINDLIERGGSHTGDLLASRMPGGRCPRDGTELVRRTIGGRTTWSCPQHQL